MLCVFGQRSHRSLFQVLIKDVGWPPHGRANLVQYTSVIMSMESEAKPPGP